MTARIHLALPDATAEQRRMGRTLCGTSAVRVTADPRALGGKRACVSCRQLLEQRQREHHLAAALPFEPTGPVPLERGQHALGVTEADVLTRSLAGDAYEHTYAWRSVEIALSALVAFRHEGQPVRSTSSPTRFDPDRVRVAGVSDRQVSALVDRLHAVSVALDRAYVGPRVFAACSTLDEVTGERTEWPAVIVPIAAQRIALLLSVAGGSAIAGKRNFSGLPTEAVQRALEERHGVRLTERQVSLVVGAGKRAVSARLREIGELAPARDRDRDGGGSAASDGVAARAAREDAMKVPGCDLQGWAEIAEHLHCGESTAQRWWREEGMPVRTVSSTRFVGAVKAELDTWSLARVVPKVAES